MGGLVDARFPHQSQSSSSRSRCRDKSYRAAAGGGGMVRKAIAYSDLKPGACDLVPMAGRAHGEGNGQFRKQSSGSNIASDSTHGSSSPIEKNSFTLEFLRRSSKKPSGTPMKALIDEEMSTEMEIRCPSPSVIARLMGLDALPHPQSSHKQQKEMISYFQKTSSIGFQGSHKYDDVQSRWMSTNEHQEFKDVFEVKESSKAEKHNNRPARRGMPCLKQNEKDVDFIRQKFMDAKHLSTDETLQDSKELNDALEILDSNKDLFLKFLQEPNSLLTKHLHDLQCCPPSPQTRHITILKSSKGTKYGSSEVCSESERRTERHAHIRKDVISSFTKPTTSRVSHSLKDHNSFHSHKLLKSQSTSKIDTCLHPTRIIVLKPRLEKAQDTARTVSLLGSPENMHVGFRRRREYHLSGIQELHEEGRQRHKMFDNVEVMRHKTKGSREIAREITKQMRRSVSSSTKKFSTPGFNRHIKDERTCMVSDMSSLNNFETHQQTSDNFDDWKNNYYPSSSYSNESSMSREARKRLSERWKTTHRFQAGLASRGSNTLGEMLALSDSETPRMALDSFIGKKVSDEKRARDEVLGKRVCPSGISSRDGWKDGRFINLPRSVSLPASSTDYGTPKPSGRHSDDGREDYYMLKDVLNFRPSDSLRGSFNRRSSRRSYRCGSNKPQSFNFGGEENKLPVGDIHIKPEETRNILHANILAEEEPMLSEVSERTIANIGLLVEKSLLPMDSKMSSIINKEQVQHPAKSGESSGNESKDIYPEETSFDHLQEDSTLSQCEATEVGSPVSSKEAEQPSPVSVLEPPSEEEKPSSKCFERINADLHDLRMQLQLLKLGSEDPYAEESKVLSSDEDTGGECDSLPPTGDGEHTFRDDDEERDFSYLLEVLVGSGIHPVVSQDTVFDACYLPEHPVDPGLFVKLENSYGVLVAWSRSERKLLFDHINSIMAEILAPCMDLQPWVRSRRRIGTVWAREGLTEVVWRTVVGQRKELSRGNPEAKVLDLRWLEPGDDVDAVGREIEKLLLEELLEELAT